MQEDISTTHSSVINQIIALLDQYGRINSREFAVVTSSRIYIRDKDRVPRNKDNLKVYIERNNIAEVHIGKFNYFKNQEESNSFILGYSMKELVFDIDLTDIDYDKIYDLQGSNKLVIRKCCYGKKFCSKCWIHIKANVLILEYFMSQLGIDKKDMLWVFSGSKGVHLIINSKKSMLLNDLQRKNIYNMIEMFGDPTKTIEMANKLIGFPSKIMNEHIMDIYLILEKIIQHIVNKKGLRFLNRDSSFMGVLNSICLGYPDQILEIIEKSYSEKNQWNFMKQSFNVIAYTDKPNPLILSMFRYFYPILDKNVTLCMSHLIKCPFSINTNSGCLSLPLTRDQIMDMDDRYLIKCESLKGPWNHLTQEQNVIINNSINIMNLWLKK